MSNPTAIVSSTALDLAMRPSLPAPHRPTVFELSDALDRAMTSHEAHRQLCIANNVRFSR